MVQWRGRGQAARTLEIYIQVVGAAVLVTKLAPSARERIQQLAAARREIPARLGGALGEARPGADGGSDGPRTLRTPPPSPSPPSVVG